MVSLYNFFSCSVPSACVRLGSYLEQVAPRQLPLWKRVVCIAHHVFFVLPQLIYKTNVAKKAGEGEPIAGEAHVPVNNLTTEEETKIQDFRPEIYEWAHNECLTRGIVHSPDDRNPLEINHKETQKFHKLFTECYRGLALFLNENNDDWDSEEGIAVADRFMRAGYASGMRCLENVIAYVDETPSINKNEYWANNQDDLSKVTREIPEQPDCFINTREMAMANQTLKFVSLFSDLVMAYYITRGKGKVVDSIPIYSGKLDDTDRVEVGVRHLLSSNKAASRKGAAHFYEEGTKQCYWRQLYNSACDITADTLDMDLMKLCDRRITQALIKDLNMDFDVDMPEWAT